MFLGIAEHDCMANDLHRRGLIAGAQGGRRVRASALPATPVRPGLVARYLAVLGGLPSARHVPHRGGDRPPIRAPLSGAGEPATDLAR